LAYLDANLEEGQRIEIRSGGKTLEGLIMETNLSAEAPPYVHPLFIPRKPAKRHEKRSLKGLTEDLVRISRRCSMLSEQGGSRISFNRFQKNTDYPSS
jgi:hypothetical protein